MKLFITLFACAIIGTTQAADLKPIKKMSNSKLESLVAELEETTSELPLESENADAISARYAFKLRITFEKRENTLKQLIFIHALKIGDVPLSMEVKALTPRSAVVSVESVVFGAFSFVDNPETQMDYFGSVLSDTLKAVRYVEVYAVNVKFNWGSMSALAIVDPKSSEILLLGSHQYE